MYNLLRSKKSLKRFMPERSLRVYRVLFRQAWRESFVVPQKIIASVLVLFIRVGLLLVIYRMAYQISGVQPNNVSFVSAIWSIGFYFVMLSSMIRQLYLDISNDVRQGTVELHVNKPYYYPLAMIVTRLGQGAPTALLTLIISVPFLYLFTGAPQIVFFRMGSEVLYRFFWRYGLRVSFLYFDRPLCLLARRCPARVLDFG